MDRSLVAVMFIHLTVLCVLQQAFGVGIVSNNFIQLPGARSEMCSKRASCRYAVCRWSKSLLIDPKTCIFVESSCHCRDFQACMPTSNIVPRSGFFKIEFVCQNILNFRGGITLTERRRT